MNPSMARLIKKTNLRPGYPWPKKTSTNATKVHQITTKGQQKRRKASVSNFCGNFPRFFKHGVSRMNKTSHKSIGKVMLMGQKSGSPVVTRPHDLGLQYIFQLVQDFFHQLYYLHPRKFISSPSEKTMGKKDTMFFVFGKATFQGRAGKLSGYWANGLKGEMIPQR